MVFGLRRWCNSGNPIRGGAVNATAVIKSGPRRHATGVGFGRWAVRLAPSWMVAMALTLVAGLMAQHPALSLACDRGNCTRFRLDSDAMARLEAAGISARLYASLVVLVAGLFAAALFTLALLVRRRGDNGRLAIAAQWVFPALAATFYLPTDLVRDGRWFSTLLASAFIVNRVSLVPAIALFPDGRVVPRWVGPAIGLAVVSSTITVVAELAGRDLPVAFGAALGVVDLFTFVAVIAAQVTRYRRHADGDARSQLRWACGGLLAMVAAAVWIIAVSALITPPRHGTAMWVVLELVTGLATLLLLGALVAAILRAGLWGIDLVVNRLLVYGTLTFTVVLVYALIVFAAARLGSDASGLPIVVAASAVGLGVLPLRARLQHLVDRAMYGARDDPGVLARNMATATSTVNDPRELLDTLAMRVALDLRLAGVSLSVNLSDGTQLDGQWGRLDGHTLRRELVSGTEVVGEMQFACRVGQRSFTRRDLDTIEVIAHQAAAVAGMSRLALDLDAARRDVVTARDLERRRLRRDLHDGLGPTLASIIQRIGAAKDGDEDQRDVLLQQADQGLRHVMADMRRIVNDLRPPELDRHGLLGALNRKVDATDPSVAVTIALEPDGTDPDFGDGTETAFYRIAEEAIYNAIRHGHARTITIIIRSLPGSNVLEIADDGCGIGPETEPGVGLRSMHERVAALGGRVRIAPGPNGRGTAITATVPVATAARP